MSWDYKQNIDLKLEQYSTLNIFQFMIAGFEGRDEKGCKMDVDNVDSIHESQQRRQ